MHIVEITNGYTHIIWFSWTATSRACVHELSGQYVASIVYGAYARWYQCMRSIQCVNRLLYLCSAPCGVHVRIATSRDWFQKLSGRYVAFNVYSAHRQGNLRCLKLTYRLCHAWHDANLFSSFTPFLPVTTTITILSHPSQTCATPLYTGFLHQGLLLKNKIIRKNHLPTHHPTNPPASQPSFRFGACEMTNARTSASGFVKRGLSSFSSPIVDDVWPRKTEKSAIVTLRTRYS